MEFVVFTEYKSYKSSLTVYYGELIDLVIPDYVICLLKGSSLRCCYELVYRGHEA
jgi:hypothetical protein